MSEKATTRRVRFVYEADVDYRDDDPGYCLSVARTDWAAPVDRIHHPELISAEYADVALAGGANE